MIFKEAMKHIIILLAGMILSSAVQTQTQKSKQKPNFVIIMADDLGYGGIGCFGSKKIKTPFLDQMAAEGIRFTDFHSNGAVCSPTRAALLTGRYQQRCGIEGVVTAAKHREVGLEQSEVTFADRLKEAGYVTGMFGKWHVGYAPEFNPIHQGFDEYVGYVSGNIDFHSHIDQEGHFDWWKGTKKEDDKGYVTDLITDYGINFIKKHSDSPFLLYLPHEAPHYPYQGRNDKPQRFVGGKKGKDFEEKAKEDIPATYKEMVEVMDEGVGKILETLKKYGLEKNTYVFFFSDNGATVHGSNGILRGHKGSLWEGGHRVPGIVWAPGNVEAGNVNTSTILTMDLYATMVDLVGGNNQLNPELDGKSFKQVLLKNKELSKRYLFWAKARQGAVRYGKWKLVIQKSQKGELVQLFNLENDLEEQKDLSEKFPKVKTKLYRKFHEWNISVRKGAKKVS